MAAREFWILCVSAVLIPSCQGYANTHASLTAIPGDIPSTETVILLDYNSLGDAAVSPFPAFSSLLELGLSNNFITRFPSLTNVITLEILRLGNNYLATITPSYLDELYSLKELYLENNILSAIPDVSGPGATLETLVVENNNLPPYPNLYNLARKGIYIYLGNQTSEWGNVPAMFLMFSFSLLTEFGLTGLGISAFPDLYPHESRIQKLQLDHNALVELPLSYLPELTSLVELDMSYNDIESVSSISVCQLSTSLSVKLAINPLRCDCDLRWLKLAQMTGIVVSGWDTRCVSPPQHSGMSLHNLGLGDLCDHSGKTVVIHIYMLVFNCNFHS